MNILEMVLYILQKLQLPSNSKSFMALRLTYSHLTLTHSKGQGQGHAHLDNKYLGNGHRYGKLLLP